MSLEIRNSEEAVGRDCTSSEQRMATNQIRITIPETHSNFGRILKKKKSSCLPVSVHRSNFILAGCSVRCNVQQCGNDSLYLHRPISGSLAVIELAPRNANQYQLLNSRSYSALTIA